FFLVGLVRFEKRVVVLQRRRHDLYTKRAAKENAKGDFFFFLVSPSAAKPEEEAVNERNEDFVSLDDMLDPEHDPQISR
ncbi:unnamed protein product, partial [Brassica rapa subsp. trilocularis]